MGTSSSSPEVKRPSNPHAQRLEQEFARFAESQSLSRANFHRTLDAVESLGFKRLRETPIADLLFDFYAVNEAITADNFRLAMEAALSASPSAKLLATFRIIAGKNQEDAMPFARLTEFFERSWQVAAQTLVDKLKLAKQLETADLVHTFAANHVATLRETLRAEFSRSGEFVSRAEFTRFMAEDRNVQIVAKDLVIEVPTSFLFLQKTSHTYPSLNAAPAAARQY